MSGNREDILDLPSRQARSLWRQRFFYAGVLGLAYYFLGDIFAWPGFHLSLVLGLSAFAMVALLRFFKYRSDGHYQFFYLLGHLSVLSGIALYLLDIEGSGPVFWSAFAFFALGLALLWRKK